MADIFLQTMRVLLAGALLIAGLFLISFVLSATEPDNVQAKSSNPKPLAKQTNSPNAITSGAAKTINGFASGMDSAGHAISGGVQATASTFAQIGTTIGRGIQTGAIATARGVGTGVLFVGRTVGTGASFVGRAVGNSAMFVFRIPGNIWGAVSNTSAVGTVIRPDGHDHAEDVPIIDPESAELQAAIAALPPTEKAAKKSSGAGQAKPQQTQGPQWPIHGRVTTEFGVDHWPYQHTHTGIDISNGNSVGVKPFRSGRVIETVHSNSGLGNHVVVDHGSGVTSVYAHLASIAVNKGQEVNLRATLGIEGTTGVSTGNHLHFEIRVHGKAANPRQFISGQP